MRLNLRDIIHVPGARREFAYDLDLSRLELFGEKPFGQPLRVTGTVRNMAGALQLAGTAKGSLNTRCDRCLKPMVLEVETPVETLLAEQLEHEESDEIYLLENGEADLDEIFSTACVLALDARHLCAEDCKGLCPRCGKDLNRGPCNCGQETDPRLAVLAKLLDINREEQ